jgi:hypothetical protein
MNIELLINLITASDRKVVLLLVVAARLGYTRAVAARLGYT